MKFVIVLACLFAVAIAAPVDNEIIQNESEVRDDGFRYYFETKDGTKAEEEGDLKGAGSETAAIVVHGAFSWISPEGTPVHVTYTADENGYHPNIEK